MNFATALRQLRIQKGLSQEEMATLLNTSKQVISRYENGQRSPKISTVAAYAAILNVPISYFSGESDLPVFNIPGVERPAYQRRPLLGSIACGEPITAEENVEEYVDVLANVPCDFLLRCKGDSMAPSLLDGDIVMIRQQPDVENGQMAAVLIDDSATLKRVYKVPDGVLLMPDNREYPPMTFTVQSGETVQILGKVVAYQRAVK